MLRPDGCSGKQARVWTRTILRLQPTRLKVRNLEVQIEDLKPLKQARVKPNPDKRFAETVETEDVRR